MTTRKRAPKFDDEYHLNAGRVIDYVERYGIAGDSREMIEEIQAKFNCRCPLAALALAAVLNGYAVFPHRNRKGEFSFHKLA